VPKPAYQATIVNDDRSETPLSARRLRVEIDPARVVEIDLTDHGDHTLTLLAGDPRDTVDSPMRSSYFVIYPCAGNCIRLGVGPSKRSS
jgi:hypothetical protein